jgi:hypothetical protein
VSEDLGLDVVPICAPPLGADDPVTHLEIGDGPLPTVCHEHPGVAG